MSNEGKPVYDELFEHHKIVADKGQAVLRIDKFLSDRLPNSSRNKIQQAATDGNIMVNGSVVKPNYKVKPMDEISIVLPYPPRETELIPENIPLNIIYEDDISLAFNNKKLINYDGLFAFLYILFSPRLIRICSHSFMF